MLDVVIGLARELLDLNDRFGGVHLPENLLLLLLDLRYKLAQALYEIADLRGEPLHGDLEKVTSVLVSDADELLLQSDQVLRRGQLGGFVGCLEGYTSLRELVLNLQNLLLLQFQVLVERYRELKDLNFHLRFGHGAFDLGHLLFD